MTFYSKDISGPLDQGDILVPLPLNSYLPWSDDVKRPLVIVTPTCDLAQEKADFHRLCVMHPLPHLLYIIGRRIGLLEAHWKGAEPLSKNKWGEMQTKLKSAVRNAWPRFHFLPSALGVFETDYIIDFEVFATVPIDDLREQDRHARMNPPYKQELIQRLASYMMRIGTPDLAPQIVESTVTRCIGTTQLRST